MVNDRVGLKVAVRERDWVCCGVPTALSEAWERVRVSESESSSVSVSHVSVGVTDGELVRDFSSVNVGLPSVKVSVPVLGLVKVSVKERVIVALRVKVAADLDFVLGPT